MTAISRRTMLEALLVAPLVGTGACCRSKYPRPMIQSAFSTLQNLSPILSPRRQGTALRGHPVIDVHAHFFNASDVPVRGFLEECLGHRAHPVAQRFLNALALIADRLADRAPTAAEELASLSALVERTRGLAADATAQRVEDSVTAERTAAATRVADAIRGSEFERLYLQATSASRFRAPGSNRVAPGEVLAVASEAERPSPPGEAALVSPGEPEAAIADGMLGFLNYMLSPRWTNLQAYMHAYTESPNAFGIDHVLGSLVDFDHWIDCPPRSAHDDQVALHGLLAQLHGGYFRPVVAYNPWTDINQNGAGLNRVVQAVTVHKFPAVKIYPPMGFRPDANAAIPATTKKSRPNLKKLDATLAAFFDKCVELRVPVIAHTARSNGRDAAHDEFGGPEGWVALLRRYAGQSKAPILDLGHFGGAGGDDWTRQFAALMASHPGMEIYGDLGYWEELVCLDAGESSCSTAKERLKQAMSTQVGSGLTVADRTMFATDWLMLSQVKRWADYPARLSATLQTIVPGGQIDKVLGLNAKKCFSV